MRNSKIIFTLIAACFLILPATSVCHTDAATEAPPPLGKMYEVGNYKMHLYATGEGSKGPSVVLEAGTGAFSLDWYLVQQKVAKFATVCSYDRAGHAWSDLGPTPRTHKQAAYDLHRLLIKAGIRGPYVMVGHSLGAKLVRIFATEFPNDVAGMVLVDHGTGRSFLLRQGEKEAKLVGPWDDIQPRQIPAPRDEVRDSERVLSKPELDGFKQFRETAGPDKIENPFDKLPEAIQKLRLWAMSLPQSNVTDYDPYGAEEDFLLFADRIRLEHPHGNMPLVVLSRKSDDQKRMEELRGLLNLSSNSILAISDFPVHEIQIAQPDLVVNAIRAVLDSVSTGRKLTLPKQSH